MEYRSLGDSDLKVSTLSLGTMTFGEQNNEADAHQQLDYAVSRGVNLIDTAEMYPILARPETQGLTEAYIGTWLKHQRRDQLIIASKIAGPARGYYWIRQESRINRYHLQQAVEASLRRLQTDYLDLYQIHWPDRYVPMFGGSSYDIKQEREAIPIAEQLQALAELVQQGKVRYLGLSNETPWGVAEFTRLARELNLPAMVSIQNAYSLVNRSFESGLAEACRFSGLGLLCYSPLASGWLTGKYHGNSMPPQARLTLFPQFGQRYRKVNVREAISEYIRIANEAGLSPASMALAFARSRWFSSSVIIGATSLEQLRANLDSAELQLSDDVLAAIEQVHARYPNPAP